MDQPINKSRFASSRITRRSLLKASALATIGSANWLGVARLAAGKDPDKVTLGTNWKAQAEHGGYYQALATGIYKKYDLDLTIRMGGPQVNHSQLLAAGVIDFNLGSNSFNILNYVKNNVPMVGIAAFFQRDPISLISHAGQGNDTLAAMKGKTILIAPAVRTTAWQFLRVKYGFSDEQARPYTFNMAPFFADKSAIQQAYLTTEPYQAQKNGVNIVINLLADSGYSSYASILETSWKRVREQPELVQRVVDASIEGWYSYLYGDPTPGNLLIKKDNPDMDDGQIAFTIATLKKYGIVDSGDSEKQGIGAMSDARWKDFATTMIGAGVYTADLDLSKAYTLQFVNKNVGKKMKPGN